MAGDEDVLVLGAASWNRMVYVDELPQGVSATITNARQVENVGSTGVGKSMVLAALGCRPTLHCTLGNDQHARSIATACDACGITMLIDTHDDPTPHHLNIMDRSGGRYSLFISNGASDPAIDEARLAARILAAGTIFLSLSMSSRKILHLLEGSTAEVLLDLHDYDGVNPWYDDFIACADVIQLSDVALDDPGPVVSRLLSGRAHQVVLTKAEKGAEIFSRSKHVLVSACPAQIVDSNGAGDAFSVGLWYAQRAGLGLELAGRFAAAAAAFAIGDTTLFPAGVSLEDIKQRASLD